MPRLREPIRPPATPARSTGPTPGNNIAKRLFDAAADAAQAGRCARAVDQYAHGHVAATLSAAEPGPAGDRARWNILRHCVPPERQLSGPRRGRRRRR